MKNFIRAVLVASVVSLSAVAPAMAANIQAVDGTKLVQYQDRDYRGDYGYRGDSWMHHRVREALRRELGRDAENVRVDVRDGNVYLSGVVDNHNERRAARDAAYSVPGVRQVFARDLRAANEGNRTFGYFPFFK